MYSHYYLVSAAAIFICFYTLYFSQMLTANLFVFHVASCIDKSSVYFVPSFLHVFIHVQIHDTPPCLRYIVVHRLVSHFPLDRGFPAR